MLIFHAWIFPLLCSDDQQRADHCVPHMLCICAGVQESLRPLKHKDVTQLRADTAREANQVLLDYREVKRLICKLQSKGV